MHELTFKEMLKKITDIGIGNDPQTFLFALSAAKKCVILASPEDERIALENTEAEFGDILPGDTVTHPRWLKH